MFLASQFQFRVLRHAAGRETAAAERALAGGSEPREHPQRAGENGANGTRRSSETRKALGRRDSKEGHEGWFQTIFLHLPPALQYRLTMYIYRR
jgi:hypothetical protein